MTYIPAGASGAPSTAQYITQIPDAGLSAEQALSVLTTGLVKVTTGTGVLSTAVGGTDYANASHTHAQADVTNLTTDLAGKASSSHTHAASDIASGTVDTARLGSGTANNTTFLRGDQTWATPSGGASAATQAEQEAASSTTVYVSPGRQHFHPGSAKCWATVTVSGGTHSLGLGYGISSITDGATGIHTVNFTTSFSTTGYTIAGCGEGANTPATSGRDFSASSKAVGSVVITCYNVSTAALADPTSISTAYFGDFA